MKNPSHPGRLLRADIEALGVSIADAAIALGVTRQQLYRVLRGDSSVTPDMAWRLERAVGGTARFWLSMQIAFDLAQLEKRKPLPKIRKIVAKAA
jgi:addiction module HigA family antidote